MASHHCICVQAHCLMCCGLFRGLNSHCGHGCSSRPASLDSHHSQKGKRRAADTSSPCVLLPQKLNLRCAWQHACACKLYASGCRLSSWQVLYRVCLSARTRARSRLVISKCIPHGMQQLSSRCNKNMVLYRLLNCQAPLCAAFQIRVPVACLASLH